MVNKAFLHLLHKNKNAFDIYVVVSNMGKFAFTKAIDTMIKSKKPKAVFDFTQVSLLLRISKFLSFSVAFVALIVKTHHPTIMP